ncbi:alkanesulfonate monooxygenase [Clostridium botulinum]|uniref:Alkanesulfonate monooxygenase n=1 Tax=Clostridium botulinum TaxID=1491 RepID=A0A9Q4XWE7_CLOBO|nr:alkanesulfonate monooxygenase [Clostridium novyi]NFD86704.1 alkanesulfonate monooxygenase [Clostridium botulinum]NFF71629.1 alkanesulfonate monooxygenase [Clostridium botulinum]NFO22921.1 alkanesulfonate monooxygenase [Clostridium botulinum]NFQ97392.1 alkanesulfonate monooxygenase [Clostridium botulinum]
MASIFPTVSSVLLPTFCTGSFNLGIISPLGFPIKAIEEDTKDLLITFAIAQST